MDEQKNRMIFDTKYIHILNAAEILGLKKQTLEKKALNGKISSTKIGRTWYFTESNLKDFLEESSIIGINKA